MIKIIFYLFQILLTFVLSSLSLMYRYEKCMSALSTLLVTLLLYNSVYGGGGQSGQLPSQRLGGGYTILGF